MTTNLDPFEKIQSALLIEAAKRPGRSVEEWSSAEEEAVFNAATEVATQYGWCLPTLEMVREAEIYASGSADYGSEWSIRLVHLMRTKVPASLEK